MNNPLPTFEPIEALPILPIADQPLRTSPPERAVAEKACALKGIEYAWQCVQRLEKNGYPVENLQACLQAAVDAENMNLIERLLSIGVPVNDSIILSAIKAANVQILSAFLNHGWDLNQEQAWCIPPWVALAIAHNATDTVISWFLDNGADPNASCQLTTTPLATAAEKASFKVVQQLLHHCPSTSSFRGYPLHFVARRTDHDSVEIVEQVLRQCRLDINAIMWEHEPLPYACYRLSGLGAALYEVAMQGQPQVAEILLREGIDISRRDSCGLTALERAEAEDNYAMVQFLRRVDKSMPFEA